MPHTTTPAGSLALQTVDELGGEGSLLARQRRDHAELDRLLVQLAQTSGEEQEDVLRRLARLVFPHAYGEETVVWPLLRRVLPDGHEITLRNEQEHQAINALFSQVERTPHDDPVRAALLDRLTALLREDVRDEEELLLPRLQAALSPEQLRRLGLVWEVLRRTAPTRPHAVVSRRPPGNVLSGLPLAILDRSRDRLDAVARSRTASSSPARAASRALAAAAGAVEQLPPLRRGEDPATRVP